MANFWIFKTEPSTYSYADLEGEKRAVWDGVRNNLALRHIRTMRKGDQALIYHSGKEKELVGRAEIVTAPYADPKLDDPKIVVVDLKAKGRLAQRVSLADVKADAAFKDLALVRMPRLSVIPVPAPLWKRLLAKSGTK